MNEEQLQGNGLVFQLSEDRRKLVASFTPVENKVPLDSDGLTRKIEADGYGELFLFKPSLAQLAKQYETAVEPFTLEIGEVRDVTVTVEVSADKMLANLTVIPPCGGEALTRDAIMRALAQKLVVSGIQEAAIDLVLAAGKSQEQQIAKGREAVNGEDGRLQCLIAMVKDHRPHLDEHGVANYRDLGGMVTVHQGERLMQRIPAMLGQAGENVLGQVILAKPGKDTMFALHLKGVVTDPENSNILVAETSGQPVLVNNGITVEPVVTLATVDLATGNLAFDGTVNVTGDVHENMTVKATGDIHVGGTVEAATLIAGGDVTIKGGIIGHSTVRERSNGDKSNIARVRCGKSCSAHFIENASVEAGDSILVDQFVMQSELAAVNQVVVGKPGSGKGRIIGGMTEATLLVQATLIGSDAGVYTQVMVGTNPFLHEKMKQADIGLEAALKEQESLDKLAEFMKSNPGRVKPEISDKLSNSRLVLQAKMDQLLAEKAELTAQLEQAENAKVVAEKTVFNNVRVEINGQFQRVERQRSGGTFSLNEEGEINFQ
jgi:uncharacterized protein (DUF342 family)